MEKNFLSIKLRDIQAITQAMGGEAHHLSEAADEIDKLEADNRRLNQEVEKLRGSILKLWYADAQRHVGSLWACLHMTWDDYIVWINNREIKARR